MTELTQEARSGGHQQLFWPWLQPMQMADRGKIVIAQL
jgi:predicted amino acid dehydrogenase